jgi:polysaccharide biosynthesis/export protein
MKPVLLLACLLTMSHGGCSWIPRAGPSTSEVVEQGQVGGEILFDVVEVDDRIVSTLLAQPKERFARRFTRAAGPPELKIAIGDTISVLIWESAAGGLFSEALPAPSSSGSRTGIEPLAPESRPPPVGERPGDIGAPGLSDRPRSEAAGPRGDRQPSGDRLRDALSVEAAGATRGRQAARIPDQQVGPDGAISVPYAGRIPAAGRSPDEVQQTIEARLGDKALEPQVLVIVGKTATNAVTVAGEVVGGARVPISPGGDRLLQVIAAAGGARAPVHETFVRLSRQGVTSTIPLEQLVSDPAENIYAQPGDVLTLIQAPQTFSVFGATGRNAKIAFDAEKLTLSEAVAKSEGLRDESAKPEGVFLFRYEPNSVVRALDQPVATTTPVADVSPVVYRFNFRDGKSYFLAQKFPIRDKDVIFVADAPAAQIYKFVSALSQVTGPIVTGLLVCQSSKC